MCTHKFLEFNLQISSKESGLDNSTKRRSMFRISSSPNVFGHFSLNPIDYQIFTNYTHPGYFTRLHVSRLPNKITSTQKNSGKDDNLKGFLKDATKIKWDSINLMIDEN